MFEKTKIKNDIAKWLEKNRGVFGLVDDDDFIPSKIRIGDLAEMLVDLEEKYGIKSRPNSISEIPHNDEETLGSLAAWFCNHFGLSGHKSSDKKLFGVYYASMEFAKQHNDPLLDVVAAYSKEEAEKTAKTTVKDHGVGLHVVSLEYYEEGYKSSTEGSDLRAAYSVLSKQIKDMWANKHKA